MSPFTMKLVELLATRINPLPSRAIEGFSSLHPIMRIKTWVDRRVSRRARVQLPATINTSGALKEATVVDMSAGGAGIIGVLGLKPGDHAVVTVDKFPPMNCEVVWASNGRAGVKFIKPN